MRYLIVLTIALSMFIGCGDRAPDDSPKNRNKSCIEYCIFDLVTKTEWHGIEADRAWKDYGTFYLKSCDDWYNVLEMETEYGAFIRTEFCSTCKFSKELG